MAFRVEPAPPEAQPLDDVPSSLTSSRSAPSSFQVKPDAEDRRPGSRPAFFFASVATLQIVPS
jgi:hypothetical protein